MNVNVECHQPSSSFRFHRALSLQPGSLMSALKTYFGTQYFAKAARFIFNKTSQTIVHKVIIQPRHANFVTCMGFKTLVKDWNEALSMST